VVNLDVGSTHVAVTSISWAKAGGWPPDTIWRWAAAAYPVPRGRNLAAVLLPLSYPLRQPVFTARSEPALWNKDKGSKEA